MASYKLSCYYYYPLPTGMQQWQNRVLQHYMSFVCQVSKAEQSSCHDCSTAQSTSVSPYTATLDQSALQHWFLQSLHITVHLTDCNHTLANIIYYYT